MQPNFPSPEVSTGGTQSEERLPKPITSEQLPTKSVEVAPIVEKKPHIQGDSANQNAGMPPLQIPASAATPVLLPDATTAQAVPTDDNPPVAQDNDLIEKEWVKKAKVVVDQTKEDPYVQNKQLNGVRVDYIKKRYNKEIKLAESS